MYDRNSAAESKGCWIGLQDMLGTGNYDWIQPYALGQSQYVPYGEAVTYKSYFLDWRRYEPNNETLSESDPSVLGGERCGSLIPWQEDPLIQEQGSWNDVSCDVFKPFVCQIFGSTIRYQIYIVKDLYIDGGILEGGQLVSGEGDTTIINYTIIRGASITITSSSTSSSSNKNNVISKLYLVDGAQLFIDSKVQMFSDAYIGELPFELINNIPLTNTSMNSITSDTTTTSSMQTMITISDNASIIVSPYCTLKTISNHLLSDCSITSSNVIFNSKLFGYGKLMITGETNLNLMQVVSQITAVYIY